MGAPELAVKTWRACIPHLKLPKYEGARVGIPAESFALSCCCQQPKPRFHDRSPSKQSLGILCKSTVPRGDIGVLPVPIRKPNSTAKNRVSESYGMVATEIELNRPL